MLFYAAVVNTALTGLEAFVWDVAESAGIDRMIVHLLRIAAGKLVAGDDGAAGPRTTTVDETRELFGDLVERLEATVLADDEESTRQRARLVQHGRAHSISRQSSSQSAV